MKITKTRFKQIIKEEIDRYDFVQKKFVDHEGMGWSKFHDTLEEFEVQTGIDYPESVLALYDILITINEELAATLRSHYSDEFEPRDKKEREEIEVEY